MLGLLVAPLMAALGDIHEATHAHASTHMHADSSGADVDGHDDRDGHEHDGLLHALMHGGHCQGHLAALVTVTGLPSPAPLSDARPGKDAAANSQHVPDNLLRPPDRSMT